MKRVFFLASVAGLMGCASTQVIESWKDPAVTGPFHFDRVVVMALSKDEAWRRTVEDELVTKIKTKTIPSYTFLKTSEMENADTVKAAVAKQGADCLVRLRLIEKAQELNYTPGAYVPSTTPLWGAPGMARGYLYEPGTLTTDTIVRLETNIYSVKDEKLLWSGISETFNPNSVKSATSEVAVAVRKELVRQQLLENKK